jgi:hypothetical protein
MNAEQPFTRPRSATVYPASCIVHPASSAVDSQRSNVQTFKQPALREAKGSNASTFNLQPSIFNRQYLILQKLNSNNKSEQFPTPPLFPLFAPDFGPCAGRKHRIVPKQLGLRME